MNKKPLILISSKRDRLRDILAVGLMQYHYQVIVATNSNITYLKASQFVPNLIIADITENNTKDILMIDRFSNIERTKNIDMLIIIPRALQQRMEQYINTPSHVRPDKDQKEKRGKAHIILYPFSFSDILKKINEILNVNEPAFFKHVTAADDDAYLMARIGEELFDSSVKSDEKLKKIAGVMKKQWIFPYTVIKALDIIGSEKSCCHELAQCIKTDLSASAAILKIANTVQYSKRQNRITDIQEAVVRLGFQQTRNLLSCFSLIDITPAVHNKSGFTRSEFWLHSLASALIAEKICLDLDFLRPELAFIAGLIHDLGKIPLDNNFQNVFPKLLEETTTNVELFFRTEKHTMNFSHAELGHYLTTEWNFPSMISLAVLHHHNPERILQNNNQFERIVYMAVFVANQLAKTMNWGHSCDEVLEMIPGRMLKELRMPKGPSDRFLTSIIREMNTMIKYLNLPGKNLTIVQANGTASEKGILLVHGGNPEFHPLALALKHNGFTVHVAEKTPEQVSDDIKVIISLPEPNIPLDVMFYEDGSSAKTNNNILKIIILDVEKKKVSTSEFNEQNLVFINKKNLDMRFVLHILDHFFGHVVLPEHQELPEDGTENLTS